MAKRSNFPDPYVIACMTGSMTVDSGFQFTISVDEKGFHATYESRSRSVSDLFEEMEYWPDKSIYTGSGENLATVLAGVAQAAGLSYSSLVDLVKDNIYDIDIARYLVEEAAAKDKPNGLVALRTSLADFHSTYQIPGLPSDDFQPGTEYAGLELQLDDDGWTATLMAPSPSSLPAGVGPADWHASTLEGLLTTNSGSAETSNQQLPYGKTELAKLLIEDDERWRGFIDIRIETP
jgi:hypothetical protein